MLAVVFFTDRAMLPGLHAALRSLLESNIESDFDIIIFCDAVGQKFKDALQHTHELLPSQHKLLIKDFTPPLIKGANSLHGNTTAYGRLYVGELLEGYDKAVYLDSDLIVNCSLNGLFDLLDGNTIFYADGVRERATCLDKQLFINAGMDMGKYFFNSGVLAIDLNRWRSEKVLVKCQEVAKKFPGQFRSADQAILNVAFHDCFGSFGDKYNTTTTTYHVVPEILEDRIYHFIGSPKPWDPLGWYLHRSHHVWHRFYESTAGKNLPTWRYNSLSRTMRTIRSSVKRFLSRVKEK